jgi:hypothetical protein
MQRIVVSLKDMATCKVHVDIKNESTTSTVATRVTSPNANPGGIGSVGNRLLHAAPLNS